jgi:hypothetical protein
LSIIPGTQELKLGELWSKASPKQKLQIPSEKQTKAKRVCGSRLTVLAYKQEALSSNPRTAYQPPPPHTHTKKRKFSTERVEMSESLLIRLGRGGQNMFRNKQVTITMGTL